MPARINGDPGNKGRTVPNKPKRKNKMAKIKPKLSIAKILPDISMEVNRKKS